VPYTVKEVVDVPDTLKELVDVPDTLKEIMDVPDTLKEMTLLSRANVVVPQVLLLLPSFNFGSHPDYPD